MQSLQILLLFFATSEADFVFFDVDGTVLSGCCSSSKSGWVLKDSLLNRVGFIERKIVAFFDPPRALLVRTAQLFERVNDLYLIASLPAQRLFLALFSFNGRSSPHKCHSSLLGRGQSGQTFNNFDAIFETEILIDLNVAFLSFTFSRDEHLLILLLILRIEQVLRGFHTSA